MIAVKRYCRGDISECGTLRFWQYQSTGKERWVSASRFLSLRAHADLTSELARATRLWNQAQRERRAA